MTSQLLKTEPMSPVYQRTLDFNGGVQPGNYSSFLPLVFLFNRNAAEGIAFRWDYRQSSDVVAECRQAANFNVVNAFAYFSAIRLEKR